LKSYSPLPYATTIVKGDVEDFFKGKRIHDRDPLYTHEFLSMLADAGIESVKLPPRSPNLNAYAERFVRSIKEESLEQTICSQCRVMNSFHVVFGLRSGAGSMPCSCRMLAMVLNARK
jgi:transposase InsO family protein